MANNPLSDITVQQIVSELYINDDFVQLGQSSQLELINSAQQEVCNLYNQSAKNNYRCNNLGDSSVLPYVRTQKFSIDAIDAQDNIVTLDEPMPDTSYIVILAGGVTGVTIVILTNTTFNVLVAEPKTVKGLAIAI